MGLISRVSSRTYREKNMSSENKNFKILIAENRELQDLLAKKKNVIESQEKQIFDLKNQLACAEINSSVGYIENRVRYYSSRTEVLEVLKDLGYVGIGVGLAFTGIKIRN